MYRGSFNDNQQEVVDELYKTIKKSIKYIEPHDLDVTFRLFKELNEKDKANEILALYLDARKDEPEIFNPDGFSFSGGIQDTEVREKFTQLYHRAYNPPTPLMVLERIVGKNGWGLDDEKILAETSVDEYYQLFKSMNDDFLGSAIRTCLKFGQFGNPSDQQKVIAQRATEALKIIGLESQINKDRISVFGIQMDN